LTEVELQSTVVKTRRKSSQALPAGFVALTKNRATTLIQNPYVTRVHVVADPESKKSRLEGLVRRSTAEAERHHKIESACVRKLLDRIKPVPVDIDFTDKILKTDITRSQNAVPFVDTMLRLLRCITMINNPPPLQQEELQAAFINIDVDDLAPAEASWDRGPIKATKVDYWYLRLTFADSFRISNDLLTPRQAAIFSAIYKKNIDYQKKYTSKKDLPEQELLNQYLERGYSKGCATREDIMSMLDGYEEVFSYPTLHHELDALSKLHLIRVFKVPGRKNKLSYVAIKPLVDNVPIEMDFSKIDAPEFKKQSAEVLDYIQNKIVKI
jgi:hypothetical protein